MDTQGSEQLVLKGVGAFLEGFKFIKTEVVVFESYKDCAQVQDIKAFLRSRGFKEQR